MINHEVDTIRSEDTEQFSPLDVSQPHPLSPHVLRTVPRPPQGRQEVLFSALMFCSLTSPHGSIS